ncbi:MAG: HXXEE domain-containing protein [Spirochaetaceae bacterium]|nr:HXXEE domain-containing protein [Spirochaetaceae bacterium]
MNFRKVNHLWQSLALLLAPIILTLLLVFRREMSPWTWMLALHLPFLMFHEIEEYVLSPMSFKEFFNTKSPLGSGRDPEYPLDEAYVFQVNIGIAWPVVIAGAALADLAPWMGMAMIWFEIIINNIMHTVFFQGGRKPTYNPGLVTNCLVLVPYCVLAIVTAAGFFRWWDWGLSLVLGAGLAAVLGSKTRVRLKSRPDGDA